MNPLLVEERNHMIRTIKVSNKVIDFILDKDRKRRQSTHYGGAKRDMVAEPLPDTSEELRRTDRHIIEE